MTFVIPTPSPTGATVAAPGTELEWAPFSVPGDAPSYTRMLARLRSASVKRGRPRELDKFTASTFDGLLDNADRALDPNYTASPWWGGIEPERQMRLGLRYPAVGGIYYPRIAAFIDGYPQNWDQAALDATVPLAATDLFKRLAQAPLPSSQYEMAVATDQPTHWWKLDEKAGGTAIDSGFSGTPMPGQYVGCTLGAAAPITFDGGRTCVTFDHTIAQVVLTGSPITGYPFTIEAIVNVSSHPSELRNLFSLASNTIALFYDANGFDQLDFSVGDGGGVNSRRITTTVGGWTGLHHIVVSCTDASTYAFIIDGVTVPVTTTTTGTGTPAIPTTSTNLIGNYPADGFGLDGNAGEVAVYNVALTQAQAQNHYLAATTGWAGSTTGAQISRVLDFLGIPNALRSIQTGNSTIGGYELPGGNALDYLLLLAATEQSPLYVDRTGVLTFRQRSDSLTATRSTVSQATYGDSGFPFHVVTANTTATSTALAGISPVLTAADVGALVVGPGIPTGTTIAAQAGATATLSAQATVTQTGATLNLGEIPYADLTPSYDETRVWNDVTFGRQGGAPQRVIDPVSRRKYGPLGFPPETSLLYADDNQALDMANWTLAHNANAIQRFVAVTFQLLDATVIPNVLAREIGDRVTVVHRPSKLGTPIQQDVIIEGTADKINTATASTVAFELSAAEAQTYWVLGDQLLGVLGVTTRLAA